MLKTLGFIGTQGRIWKYSLGEFPDSYNKNTLQAGYSPQFFQARKMAMFFLPLDVDLPFLSHIKATDTKQKPNKQKTWKATI